MAATVQEHLGGLRHDCVPEYLKGHAHVRGVPKQQFSDLLGQYTEKIRLQLRVRGLGSTRFDVLGHRVLELVNALLHCLEALDGAHLELLDFVAERL